MSNGMIIKDKANDRFITPSWKAKEKINGTDNRNTKDGRSR